MELKNVNSNGDNVVASNLNNVNLFLWKIEKIDFKKEHHVFFFLQDVVIVEKIKFFVLFTSLIEIK
jgi:hypothetical protein